MTVFLTAVSIITSPTSMVVTNRISLNVKHLKWPAKLMLPHCLDDNVLEVLELVGQSAGLILSRFIWWEDLPVDGLNEGVVATRGHHWSTTGHSS